MKLNILKPKTDKLLSIDFGQLFIKIAYAQRQDKAVKLIAYDLKKITLSEDNIAQVVGFIRDFLKKNSISTKDTYLTISDPNCVIIKNITLPQLPKNEVLKALEWQLKDELNISWDTSSIQWRLVKEYADEEGANKQEIVLVSLKDIDRHLSISRQCNLLPLGITNTPFNYANILRSDNIDIPVEAILDIGSADSTLCIYSHNKLALIRRLAFSTEKITQSLTDTLLTAKGPVNLSYEEAEQIRDKFGIPQDESIMLEENLAAIHVISLMRPLLEVLVRELKSSFDYFISNHKEESPAVLYLTGGGANLKNLDTYLDKEIKVKISCLPFPPCVDITGVQAQALEKDKNQLVNALGAILAGPESINFLPPEAKIQRIEPMEKGFLKLVAFAAAAFLGISYCLLNLQIGHYKKRLKSSLSVLQKSGEIKAGVEKIIPLEDIVYEIKKHNVPAEGVLKLLSTALPRNVILDELILDQKSDSLTLRGVVSLDKDRQALSLTKAIETLNASSFFKNATLVSSKKEADIESFEITCELVY